MPFDICPRRLRAVQELDPGLVAELGTPFREILEFFGRVESSIVPRLLSAFSLLLGDDLSAIHKEKKFNMRVIDYFTRPQGGKARRCGEHRDFGSFTLVFQDAVGGLEAKVANEWRQIPAGCVVVTFGWCMAIRSNDRLSAVLPRVVDPPTTGDVVPRRNSAVFFVAPDMGATLAPVLRAGEKPKYKSIVVQDLKNLMAKRWRRREGTDDGDAQTGGSTGQDDLVDMHVRLR